MNGTRSGGGSREDVMEAGSNSSIAGAKAGATALQPGEKGKPAHAPHSCLLSFCRAINVAAGTAAILCLVAHLMALSISSADSVSGPRSTAGHTLLQVLRLYGCCTALLCLVIEFEWDWILAWVRGAENWIGRGMLQGFLGCFTLELASSEGTSEFERSLAIYRLVAGFAMIGTAIIYFSGGLLCVGIFKKAQHRKVMERQRMERDIELLDKQREDLRIMLSSYVKD